MIRKLPALLCLLALLAPPAPPANAQLPLTPSPTPAAPATPTSATSATETTPPPPITPEQARQAVEVLTDPAKRAEIIATLQAIARAHPPTPTTATSTTATRSTATPSTATPATATPTPATPTTATPTPATSNPAALGIPLTPDSLGAEVLVGAANFMNHAADRVTDAVHAARGFPLLWAWTVTMATDPVARLLLIDVTWRLAIALAGSFAILCCTVWLLRRPLHAVGRRLIRLPPAAIRVRPGPDDEPTDSAETHAEHGEIAPPAPRRVDLRPLLRRVPLVLVSMALFVLPVIGFVVAGHVIAGTALGGTRLTRLVLLAVIDSYALCAFALYLARALLAPRHRRLRLLPVPDLTASYAMRWTRRLLVVGVFGYAVAEVGLLLGLTEAAHLALLKATAFILESFIAVMVIQKRRVVRGWIRAPAGAQGIVAGVRNRLAAVWHWIALFYLAALWVVWAAALPTGYERVSQALLIILGVALLGRVASRICMEAVDRLLSLGANTATRYPGLDSRLARYHPFLNALVRITVSLLMLLLVLQLLGLDAFQWMVDSPLGQHITGSLLMLAVTCLLALAVWETVNIGIERHLARLTQQAQIARIGRLRTLLPILRTTLLVAVLTVTGLMVLSEIGVNTAPLLASAGIIGVAIGFGSQTLVRDLITGLFLLLENTMQVGDVISLGGLNLSGVIENLSVRTLRLRAEDGSVHVVPFSSVTTVTNMTRDYGQAVIQVGVAYKENVDRVIEVLKAIMAGMRTDSQFHDIILGDLDVYGLDQFAPSAVIIKGRVMCTPFGRWAVGREFNRRLKARFEELGIAMPSSDTRLVLDQPLSIRQLPGAPVPE